MVNALNKITIALRLANERNLPIGPDLKVGSNIHNVLSTDAVLREVIKNLGLVFKDNKVDSFQRYEELRRQVRRYEELHPDGNNQLLQKTHLLISFLFLKSYPEHNGPIELPEGSLYLTNDLSVSTDALQKMPCWRYIATVIDKVHEYLRSPLTSDGPTFPKKFLEDFRKILEAYEETQPLWDQDKKRAELLHKDIIFLVLERVRLESCLLKLKNGIEWSHESTRVEELLENVKANKRNISASDYNFELLTDVRDRLFVEKKLLYYLLSLLHSTVAIADRIDAYSEQDGIKIKEDKGDKDTQLVARAISIYRSEESDLLALGLQLLVNRMGKRFARSSCDITAQPLISKLVSYKSQNEGQDEAKTAASYARFVAQLEINELQHQQAKLLGKWKKLKFTASALIEDVALEFEKAGYLMQKRLAVLLEVGRLIHNEFKNTSDCKTKERFRRLREVATICMDTVRSLQDLMHYEEDFKMYQDLTNAIDVLVKRAKPGARTSLVESYKQVFFHSLCGRSEPRYHEYVWKKIDADAYRGMIDQIRAMWGGISSKTSFMLNEAERDSNEQPQGFDAVVPQFKKMNRTGKKVPKLSRAKRRLQSLKSIEQETTVPAGAPQPESPTKIIAKSVSQLALGHGKKVSPLKQLSAKPAFKYHERVIRWFAPIGSDNDPFVSDPHYRDTVTTQKVLWGRVKHNFALAVDTFIGDGIQNTDRSQLTRMRLTKQAQIVGEIAIDTLGCKEFRRGVFTYSNNLTGICIHRCFTRVPSERIQSEYTQNGWMAIDLAKHDQEPLQQRQGAELPNSVLADDESYVIRETNNLVVIKDPKNSATITLVKMLTV